MKTFEQAVWVSLLVAGLIARVLTLDVPTGALGWREADTAYMARRMMHEWPPEMLRPKAPYRGTNDVKAAEYPIYPLTVALVYKGLGRESETAARIVSMLYFCGAAWLLWLAIAEIGGRRLAWWTISVYGILPLNIVYSRAFHPDFCVVFFSHLFFYAFLTYFTRGETWRYLLAVFSASAAFLMKAPYAFYFALPVAAWVLYERKSWTLRNLSAFAFVFLLPLAGAVWFNHVRLASEAPFEESIVYPMKWTPHLLRGHFFGSLGQRFEIELWKNFLHRFLYVTATPVGAVLAVVGLFWPTTRTPRLFLALLALYIGVGLFVLILFSIVTSTHDYYSIPATVLASLGAGSVMSALSENRIGKWFALLLAGSILAGSWYGLMRVGPYRYGGGSYFAIDWQRYTAGLAIGEYTRPDDLVVSVCHGRSTGGSDPRILYTANRLGWSVEWDKLSDEDWSKLKRAGATVAAVLETPQREGITQYPLFQVPPYHVETLRDPSGNKIGRVLFFRVRDGDGGKQEAF